MPLPKQYRIIFLLLFLLFSINLADADQRPDKLFNQFRKTIVRVEFFKNITANSEIGNYVKKKEYRIGLIVRPSGLIMVSSDVYPLSLNIMSGQGGSFFSAPPSDFKITLANGKSYQAKFVGKDDQAEVAFLKATLPADSTLDSVTFVLNKKPEMGDKIYLLELLRKKYDFAPLFTPAYINAVIRKPRFKYIVNHETPSLSAGGLVIDTAGNAIGITLKQSQTMNFNSAPDFGDSGSNFYTEVAPANWFKDLIANPPVLKSSRNNGKPWLGIRMQALSEELQKYWKVPFPGGVVVDKVLPKSPAEKAGLHARDIILALNGKPTFYQKDEDLLRFRETVSSLPSHQKAAFKIFRDGKIFTKKIEMESAPLSIDMAPKLELPDLGIEVREISRDVLYQNELPLDTKGLYVFRVDPAAPAGLAGLEIGQIITHVDQQHVHSLKGFEALIQKSRKAPSHKILIQVLDRKRSRFIFIDKNK